MIEKTRIWVDDLKKARKVDDKSNNRSIVYLLRLSKGHATISSDKKDGDYLATSNQYEGSTNVMIHTDIISIMDEIVIETDTPYWVYTIILSGKLDLTYIESQIRKRTGEEFMGGGEAYNDGKLVARSIQYTFGSFNGAGIRLTITSCSNERGSMIEMVINRSDNVGFYRAHYILTYDAVLSLLLGEFTPVKRQLLIKEACSRPLK